MDDIRISKSWVGPNDTASPCDYNIHVGCALRHCETCGWNPFVAIKRISDKYGSEAVKYLTLPNK